MELVWPDTRDMDVYFSVMHVLSSDVFIQVSEYHCVRLVSLCSLSITVFSEYRYVLSVSLCSFSITMFSQYHCSLNITVLSILLFSQYPSVLSISLCSLSITVFSQYYYVLLVSLCPLGITITMSSQYHSDLLVSFNILVSLCPLSIIMSSCYHYVLLVSLCPLISIMSSQYHQKLSRRHVRCYFLAEFIDLATDQLYFVCKLPVIVDHFSQAVVVLFDVLSKKCLQSFRLTFFMVSY